VALNPTILEQGFLELSIRPPTSVPEFALRFATFYEVFALTATPLPVTAGRRPLLEQAVLTATQPARTGSVPRIAAGYSTGLAAFWAGVVVPGGAVTAFLGGPLIAPGLLRLARGDQSAAQAAKSLAQTFLDATRLVQYVIAANPPAFLV
jgi:hypothetical protein